MVLTKLMDRIVSRRHGGGLNDRVYADGKGCSTAAVGDYTAWTAEESKISGKTSFTLPIDVTSPKPSTDFSSGARREGESPVKPFFNFAPASASSFTFPASGAVTEPPHHLLLPFSILCSCLSRPHLIIGNAQGC
jgi:hypothetical protein